VLRSPRASSPEKIPRTAKEGSEDEGRRLRVGLEAEVKDGVPVLALGERGGATERPLALAAQAMAARRRA